MEYRHWYKRLIVLVTSGVVIIGILTACITKPVNLFDEMPVWSPDGRYLVHTCYRPNMTFGVREVVDPHTPVDDWVEICITDVDSHHRVRITQNERFNYSPSWSPDGMYIAFVEESGLLVSTPKGTAKEISLGKQVVEVGNPYTWSPDGLHLCFTAMGAGDKFSLNANLYIVDLSDMMLRQLTDLEGDELEPAWSPNSDKIAFVWFPKGVQRNAAHIHVIDVESGNSEQIIKTFVGASLGKIAVSELMWSPDGKLLAFIGSRNVSRSAVYLVDVGTRQLDQITTEIAYLSSLAWSPDGSRLAFTGQGPRGDEEIFTVRPDGTDLKQITDQRDFDRGSSFSLARGQQLTWSPDGQFLAFVRAGKKMLEQRIWVIRADGSSSPRMITGK
jgi:Tol biopolymer transport system component